ncbi:uncharacterized protein PAC_04373 [Phialocephala subalpina]|uniref:RING-type domain-containing protein n=1 Tax=Phialocephala subalpina TaxID=576137 RepID=A0A1L7WNZ2_9HELO|nr:uncharacterized protein PAC_04373 [Phialocephala subalpina]
MPCIIRVNFRHACGHTSAHTSHSPGCPTFRPYTTPIIGFLLNAVLPRTCITFEAKHIYINTQCESCASSGASISLPSSQIEVFTIPKILRRRKEYKRLVNQQEDIEKRHRQALAMPGQVEAQWLQAREAERLLQERAGVPFRNQTLVYHPRPNKGDKFLQKSTFSEAGEFCGFCQDPDPKAEGDHVRRLPCGHRFHFRCIKRWLDDETHSDCPACRREYNLVRTPHGLASR